MKKQDGIEKVVMKIKQNCKDIIKNSDEFRALGEYKTINEEVTHAASN